MYVYVLLYYKIKTYKVPNYLLIYKQDFYFYNRVFLCCELFSSILRAIRSIFTMKAGNYEK